MREILFRARRINTGEWVEGFYVHIPCGRFLCDEHFIQTVEEDGRIGLLCTVYEHTVGQFTGLTDKNGKRIFEGDIICYITPDVIKATGVVRFGEYGTGGTVGMGFYVEWVDRDGAGWLRQDICFWAEYRDVEVIGNIYDNPELMHEAK